MKYYMLYISRAWYYVIANRAEQDAEISIKRFECFGDLSKYVKAHNLPVATAELNDNSLELLITHLFKS